jgi:type IV fimbrial biogenesis protein FimT
MMAHSFIMATMQRPLIRPIARLQSGFTLVELLVTISITAVLMAIAVPDFVRSTRSIELDHQAKELEGAIKFANAEAVRRRQPVVICRANAAQSACNIGTGAGDWSNGWLIFVDINNNQQYQGAPTDGPLLMIKQPQSAGTVIKTSATSQLAENITFNPAGEPAAGITGTGLFTFSNARVEGVNTFLTFNKSGRVRIFAKEQCTTTNAVTNGCVEQL